jgi:hypothetical protein
MTVPLGQTRATCPPDGRSALDGNIAGVDMSSHSVKENGGIHESLDPGECDRRM